ncbi:hypothetical protein Glove_166g257 [Diversispora epigaea]|uniref:Uncharacterized protein n=1 Tax=Diversispora epigaea TaxID=1348612 RepID=A0A397IU83_9GLOM|nr:hypothetical protein Glove_166g257 [Diversispora epigaea]
MSTKTQGLTLARMFLDKNMSPLANTKNVTPINIAISTFLLAWCDKHLSNEEKFFGMAWHVEICGFTNS